MSIKLSAEKLKIIFMGTPAFSVPVLAALAAAHDVVAVYCQPPKPAGRGMEVQKTPVHLEAERLGIPVFAPKSFRKEPDAVDIFRSHDADLAVVVAYGMILPQDVLDVPRLGCVNIHASLLPRWRGAAPLQRAIEAGDTETGVCIMQMEAGLDTGPVWRTATTPITDQTTLPALHDTLSALGAREILAALPDIAAGIAPTSQPDDGVTYAKKVERDEGRIDWNDSAALIHRKLRAFTPWPGLFFTLHGARVKVLEAAIANGTGTPGTLIDKLGIVACGTGALQLIRIQREGKPQMAAADFLRGMQSLHEGDHLA